MSAFAVEGESWGAIHERARDDASRAWTRLLGMNLLEAHFSKGDPPPILERLAAGMHDPIEATVTAVIGEMDLEFDGEARRRVTAGALKRALSSAIYNVKDAIADEVARPQPVPFVAPAAGSWVRGRRFGYHARGSRKPETGPRWDGPWHLFSGDWKPGDQRSQTVYGRARCGARVVLRAVGLLTDGAKTDYVAVDEMPAVDTCGTCRRIAARP